MKKIMTSLLLAFVLLLVACVDTPPGTETDTEKPVIIGADDKTIEQGTPFDPLEGVSVTDNKDTLTLTLANVSGTVNVNAPGTYTLTYTISDAAGNEAVKVRVITVVAPAPLGNLIGGDFSSANLPENWEVWVDTGKGYVAPYSIANGAVVIDIQTIPTGDDQWWAVQLKYKALELEAFHSYTLKFDIKSDAPRYVNHQIQGGGIPGGKAYGEINLVQTTTQWQTITQDFYVRGDATNAELQFAMGTMTQDRTGVPAEFAAVETKVYLDNIVIVEGPELENTAPEITAQNLVVRVGQQTPLKQGITVVDDFSTINIADVVVTQLSPETPFNPANPAKGVYTFQVVAEDEEGLSTTVTRTITVADPWNRPLDLEPTPGPADGWWVFEANDGNFIDVTKDGNVTAVEILEIANDDWMAMFRVDSVQFFAGTYEIEFEIRADKERQVRVAIEGADLGNQTFVHVTAGEEWSYVKLTYTFAQNQTNKVFAFWFGSLTTVRDGWPQGSFDAEDNVLTTVYFKNFNVAFEGELIEPVWNVPTDLVVSTENNGWWVFEADGDWIDVTNQDGMAVIDIKAIANDDWKAMFRVNGVNFQAGTYRIRFDARAEDLRQFRVAIEGAGLSNTFEHFEVGSEWITVELVYEFESPQSNKTFAFWFGSLTTSRPGFPEGSFVPADDVLTTLYLKNFRVEYEEGIALGPWSAKTDLVPQGEGGWDVGGTFDGWWVRQVDQPEGIAKYMNVNHEAGVTSFELIHIAGGDWQAAFLVEKVQFYAGTYTIKFDIRSDIARQIRIAVEGINAPDTNSWQDVSATTDWETIELTYTFTTDQLGRAFQFWFGTLTTSRPTIPDGTHTEADDILTTVYIRNFEVTWELA